MFVPRRNIRRGNHNCDFLPPGDSLSRRGDVSHVFVVVDVITHNHRGTRWVRYELRGALLGRGTPHFVLGEILNGVWTLVDDVRSMGPGGLDPTPILGGIFIRS